MDLEVIAALRIRQHCYRRDQKQIIHAAVALNERGSQ